MDNKKFNDFYKITMPKKKIKVLFASAEVAPFAKTGGLGDVVGSLPGPLKKLGADVRIVMPKYGFIDSRKNKLKKIKSDIGIKSNLKIEKINLWEGFLPGLKVPVYFIENKRYFSENKVYFSTAFDSERFLFFSLAALQILPEINFKPDVIHCHDYHSAMIPDLIKANRGLNKNLENVRTVYTIHNFLYQGQSNPKILSTGNLSKNSLDLLKKDSKDGDINFVVQGVLGADAVTTVSETYAKEITTKEFGAGLEKIIRKRKKDLTGILNGIDVDFFNPGKDKNIYKNYDFKAFKIKKENKAYLQKKLGLPGKPDVPMIGLVSRLTWQKGVDFISDDFGKLDCQYVFLGTGEGRYEQQLKNFAKKFPDKVSANMMFDVKLANQIYASADMFLMPSRYEPCGLGQMIAMCYGTVPVVRETGGLKDTVERLSEKDAKAGRAGKAKGFSFKNTSSEALFRELKRAVNIYYKNKKVWEELQSNGMREDFSWNNSAKKYLELYRKIIG